MNEEDQLVEITDLNRSYWEALKEGRLTFQRCRDCGFNALPPRRECTRCLSENLEWQEASGKGKLLSWVVYRMSYHPTTKDRIPYNVAIVELSEGPRLITNIVGVEDSSLVGDEPVEMVPVPRGNVVVPCFTPTRAMP